MVVSRDGERRTDGGGCSVKTQEQQPHPVCKSSGSRSRSRSSGSGSSAGGPGSAGACKRRRGAVADDRCARRRLELGGKICAVPFLAPEACREFVALCEEHAAALGGWSKELAVRYPQTTTDLEVDRVPALRGWLRAADVMPRVRAHFAAAHGAQLHALDDLFVIKYDARGGGEQRELRPHRDAGDFSFMVALSARSDYTGGGTHYPELGHVVHLEQGEMLSFDADLVHSGVPIRSGVRYLLVGFCHCGDPAAATEPGNISCDTLEMIGGDLDAADGPTQVPEPVAMVRQRVLGSEAVSTLRADALRLHAFASRNGASSYWVDATATPRTAIEQFALEVLAMHVPSAVGSADAGAEIWVQRLQRRTAKETEGVAPAEQGQQGVDGEAAAPEHVPFHFDKDEAALRDRGAWEHPACATVTYLSAARRGDLPTVVFDSLPEREAVAAGNDGADQPRQACISYPSEGKHLAFRGKYLHGCPLELARSRQPGDVTNGGGGDNSAGRLTLLVNLWTKGTRPTGLQPLPILAVAQISGPPSGRRALLSTGGQPEQLRVVVANSRRRGGVGPAVSLVEHVGGMTAPLPVAAVAAAEAESSCLCMFA